MSKGVNKVLIIGNLGNDPEVHHTNNGKTITNISVATTESWKDKQTGEQKSETEWHRVVFFNRLAEIAGEYLKKGSQVYIEGKLKTRKWQDQSGQDRYTTEVVANEMQMLGSRLDGRGGASEASAVASAHQGADGGQPSPHAATNFYDDEVPF